MTEEGLFLGGGNSVGSKIYASAPNITGSFMFKPNSNDIGRFRNPDKSFWTDNPGVGAFSYYGHQSQGEGTDSRCNIDASRCSSIYGRNGNTLYPNHYIVEFYIKYK